MSADLTKREVCKQSQQQLKTPMIPGDETILIPIVANFFATGGSSLKFPLIQSPDSRATARNQGFFGLSREF